ncbi:MAG: helix-turn-helix domain-containing protein, partial [Robiginitomaculum sp.]|nr:helix-turn-helix domain-containing protein [Robiginitomaculum sp.]
RTSARTLQRRFKVATGYSPHMWLTIERVELAKDLLETTNINIQQIANTTGLKTPETFRHHFKRITGISPTQYRAKHIDFNP